MVVLGIDIKRFRLGRRTVTALALVCILLVSGLGYFYYTEVGYPIRIPKVRKDIVGVITVEGPISSSQTASRYTDIINQAVLNESVKAVVLRVDSPGGYADYIEQVYLDILELKKEKPLVASIVSALSGGYYISVAADYIYVHPTSMVGNIGVIGEGPPTLIPSEIVFETGAYKATGFSKLLFPFNLTHALDNFVSAVEKGRGNRLKLTSMELRKGMIYLGSEALAAGLVDEVGSLQSAVKRAAKLANLTEYEVVDIRPAKDTHAGLSSYKNETKLEWRDLTIETLRKLNPPPAIYYLYLPNQAYIQSSTSPGSPIGGSRTNEKAGAGRADVVVDLSHGNRISTWELDILTAELAIRNITVRFAESWDDAGSALANASALIVAAPTEPYSWEEGEGIEGFVKKGRILLLFFDPAYEYLEIPALFGPINSIANRFGLSFAKGYLYNLDDHYGFYRNIYVRNFAESNLTRGLSSLVLFTATHIYAKDGLAWASSDTYSSTAERVGNYTVMAMVERNGTVAAFGDLTFLMEPYCYVEDNYALILNLVSALTGVEAHAEAGGEPRVNVTKPDLPVGTEKIFTEQVDGKEQQLRWVRASETDVRIERPNSTTLYHYDKAGSLLWWESDGMKIVYSEPLPEEPYPLTKGKKWSYGSPYDLTIGGEVLKGRLGGEEEVVEFEAVKAGDGVSYLSAKVAEHETDQFSRGGMNVTIVTTGYSWVSSEAGVVKGEYQTKYYVDGLLSGEETRRMILISIKK